MKRKIQYLFLIGLMIANPIMGQKIPEVDFSIIFGDCFKGDTISLFLNDNEIFKDVVLFSETSTGLTKTSIYQDKNNLVSVSQPEKHTLKKLKLDKTLKILIMNGKSGQYFKILSLRKGRIILIDFCNQKGQNGVVKRNINMSQYKKTISFY
jgi:hypothetical protein